MFLLSLLFFLGASLASFFVLVGERVSKRESIVRPRSHCSYCQHELRWSELVPVFSYCFLEGRCLYCFNHIGHVSTLWELFSGLLFMLLYRLEVNALQGILLCLIWFIVLSWLNRTDYQKILCEKIHYK